MKPRRDGRVRCSAWLDRCPHCGGEAKLEIEPTSPPHPWSTHTGEWREDAKSAFVQCADCHCGTNSVPEDMWEIVVKRWNKRSNDRISDPAMSDVNCNQSAGAGFAEAHGSDASACDSRPPEAKQKCMYGHPDTCDTLCKLWGCKFIQEKGSALI